MVSAGAFNEVQHGRYLRFLQKFLGMKGREPSEVTLAAEIMPQISLFHGSENRYLEGWSMFAQGGQALGAAGSSTNIQLRNPGGSNVILSVVDVIISPTLAAQMQITTGSAATDLGGVGTALREFDGRGNRNSTAFFSSNTTAALQSLGDSVWNVQTGALSLIHLINYEDLAVPLVPGKAMLLSSITQNVNVSLTFVWRERFLEDAERA